MTFSLQDLKYLMERLRDPETGCPWDIKQTFATIVPSTIEEAYEVADAIEKQEWGHVKEELGDLLFQVIFYSQLGNEQSLFDFDGVVDQLVSKLIRRHPHVFPSGNLYEVAALNSHTITSDEAIKNQWESIKQQERNAKGQAGLLADIPQGLPALTRAEKLQKRASGVGFDWPELAGVLDKLKEEIEELEEAIAGGSTEHMAEELGDTLFSLVNVARHLKLDTAACLRQANRKFENRFAYIEKSLAGTGVELADASLEQMDNLWNEAKITS